MNEEVSNIENRPEELYELPYYKGLPELPVEIDLNGFIGEFLTYDLYDLDGVHPIEASDFKLNDGQITINPCEALIERYKKDRVTFQMISVVVNAYGFREENGVLRGKPYNISLKAASKRGNVEEVTAGWVEKMDIEMVSNSPSVYSGFNPFKNAFGFYAAGFAPSIPNLESDMIGFVHNTYLLATKFDNRDLAHPEIPLIKNNNQVRRDYEKYRQNRYFKKFTKNKPRRIWGCDSPIELFLLQAMDSLGLNPELQTMICDDGTTVPTLHTLWENQKSRRRIKQITDADFFFPEKKLAVFCDSKQFHSDPKSIEKDKAIDDKLEKLGIHSLRVYGVDIAKSPLECAKTVQETLNTLA